MPILNSVVESTEVFNRKRKDRLKTYQANNSENDEPPHEVGQWKVDPLVSAPEERSSDSATLEDVAGVASVEQDQPAGLPDRAVQADEAQDPEATPQLTAEEGPKQEVERRSAPKRQQKKSAKASTKPLQASDQMYLKMNVAYPAAGVSPTYGPSGGSTRREDRLSAGAWQGARPLRRCGLGWNGQRCTRKLHGEPDISLDDARVPEGRLCCAGTGNGPDGSCLRACSWHGDRPPRTGRVRCSRQGIHLTARAVRTSSRNKLLTFP